MTTCASSSCLATRQPVVPPVEQALAPALGDTFELRSEAADVVHPQAVMVACTSPSSPIRDDASVGADRGLW
jgi:hypothetical protein